MFFFFFYKVVIIFFNLEGFGILVLIGNLLSIFFMEQLAPNAIALESNVQVDARVVTSRGPTTTMEFAVKLVKQLYDECVDDISKILVFTFSLIHSFSYVLQINLL